MQYFIALGGAFLISFFLMPLLIKVARKIGFTDKPNKKRKQHRKPMPLSGGIGIYISFFIIYFIMVKPEGKENFWIFIGTTLILLIGIYDDSFKSKGKEFPIAPRLVIQLLSAYLVYRAGVVFRGFDNPFSGNYVLLPDYLQCILTITWIFGVTTVINWSDGMDGLAGGISIVSSITFFLAALILNQEASALTSIMLTGSILGFFMFNKHPAKIFMGDSGANVIGFLLAIIAIDGAFKQATVMSLFLPIFALAVPIFDNLFVIFKRFNEGKPVYQADRSQIHFRLQEKGFSIDQVVNYIIIISIIFSTISIALLLIKT